MIEIQLLVVVLLGVQATFIARSQPKFKTAYTWGSGFVVGIAVCTLFGIMLIRFVGEG